MKFRIKQWIKMLLQNRILPFVYWMNGWRRIDDRLIVFADAHHNSRPESMKKLYEVLRNTDYRVVELYNDYGHLSVFSLFFAMCKFMRLYAKAGTVIICDNFLPVAACRKKEGTRVIQLWHGCGAFKKFGYDATHDIPSYYKGEVYQNYDLVTVSSEACVAPFASAMHQDKSRVRPYGVSRTDVYFTPGYRENLKNQIYEKHPEFQGKKILLWAPTFRGNAAMPTLEGLADIQRLEKELGEDWCVLYSLHPHLYGHLRDETGKLVNSQGRDGIKPPDFSTEQLIAIADVFVTDYSSVLYDAVLLGCPVLLFAPDLEQFQKERGFYMPLEDFPGVLVTKGQELKEAVIHVVTDYDEEKQKAFGEKYLSACDGRATDRIVKYITADR